MATRIHLCGAVTATIEGGRVEGALGGRQGRRLFAYLVSRRLYTSSRAELVDAVWADEPPAAVESALSALVSKLRSALGSGWIEGRSELRVVLPDDAWVDVESASAALHRAESATVRQDWTEAWIASRIAQHIAVRPFVRGDSTPWIEERRRELEGTYLRALELAAQASLGIGGGELDTAERTARSLVRFAPFRESGYRYLMRALELRDNRAEALQIYDQLRQLFRNELGISPSPTTEDLYRRLLG